MKKLFTHPGRKILSLMIVVVIILSVVPISAAQDDTAADNVIPVPLDGVEYDSTDDTLEHDGENSIENNDTPNDDPTGAGGDEASDEGTTQTDSGADSPLDYSIIRFSLLEDNVRNQPVSVGTPLEDLALPDSLRAEVVPIPVGTDAITETDGTETTVEDVTWQADPEYDPEMIGTYVFTPELPDGFSLADGVTPPVITVEVRSAMSGAALRLAYSVASITDKNGKPISTLNPQVTQVSVTPELYNITLTLPSGASVLSADVAGATMVSAAENKITVNTITADIVITNLQITVAGATLETVPLWSDILGAGVGVLNLFTLPGSAVGNIGNNPVITYGGAITPPTYEPAEVNNTSGRRFFYRVDTFVSPNTGYTITKVEYTYGGIAAENAFNESGTTPASKNSGEYDPLKDSSPLVSGARTKFSYNGTGNIQTAFNNIWGLNHESPWYFAIHNGYASYQINSGLLVWVTTKQLSGTDLTELAFTIYNKSNTTISNTNISFDADVQIGTDDKANINAIEGNYGFLMAHQTQNLWFAMINANAGKYGSETAPNWWGFYAERSSHVNDDMNTTEPSIPDTDTGAVAKVRGITLAPGELQTYSFFIGVDTPEAVLGYIDSLLLVISSGTVNRLSDDNATIGFSSSMAGDAYYFVRDSSMDAPVKPDALPATGWNSLGAASAGSNSISMTGLTSDSRYIYVVVVDSQSGYVSNMLEIPLVQLITNADITVTAPVTGAAPDPSASGTGDFNVVGNVTWTPAAPAEGFLDGTAYTATVTLKADDGYIFSPLLIATINGNEATVLNNSGDAVTLSYRFPEITGDVSGNITEDGNPAANVTVKVMTGGTYGKQIASTTTDTNGYYSFSGLAYGVYSLVATNSAGVTVTKMITIEAPHLTANMEMPTGNQNTYVRIVGETPSIAADNLDDTFSPQDIADSKAAGKVTITLIAEAVGNPADANLVAQHLRGKRVGMYLDMKLRKTITGSVGNDCDNEPIQPQDDGTLTVVVNLPPTLRGHSGYSIIRVHDNRDVAIIPATYNNELHTLAFEADLFSTYAIVYTSNTGSSSNGSSGRRKVEYPATSSYWIEVPEARTLAQTAHEKQRDYARSKRDTITGIRKDSLLVLAESGLRYQHDTVADNAVQVRVYIKDPGKAVKDILVSGYVAGDAVEKTNARFERYFQNKVAVISMEQQGHFGIQVQIAAKVDLSNMDTGNLYFYSYDRQSGKYVQIQTEYRIDSKGYVHFATILAGDIIISDGPLTKQGEAQTSDTSAPPTEIDLHNPSTGGDSLFSIYTGDILKLEQWDDSGAGAALPIGQNSHLIQNTFNDSPVSNKPNAVMIAIIIVVSMVAAMLLWVIIPRKDDVLIPIEEYRQNR